MQIYKPTFLLHFTKQQSFIHTAPMAILGYVELLLGVLLCFLFLGHWKRNKSSPIINWPVLGMVPGLLRNASHMYECTTQVLKHYEGTVEVKGPWFAGMDFVVTSDPTNVHHILSKNFANYEKGSEFREILEPLGDGLINSDGDWWTYQRKLMQSFVKNSKFELFLEKVIKEKVVNGLIPVLSHVSKLRMEVDLQEVFKRFTFDNSCLMVLGFDPISLSVEFPERTYEKAFDEIEEALLNRHIVPKWCWKLQRWLQLGEEKKLRKAWETFDGFLNQCISSKREQLRQRRSQLEEADFDLLTAYMEIEEEGEEMGGIRKSDKFLRDTAFNLMAAGSDTMGTALAWFSWLVATHPSVETKILEEIKTIVKENKKWECFGVQELDSQVYLHAALCEALRLYPVVAFDPRTSIGPDILPSGHHVNGNTRIVMFLYAMGRTEEIWGEDCLQYKPERWISEQGGIIAVPSYKFTSFGGGRRSCIGKAMAFIQMKMVATATIWNYHVQVVEGHPVSPSASVVLHMKHGCKVKITKRSSG